MPAEDILNEPLFFNQQISVPLGSSAIGSADDSTTSRPLTPHDQPSMLAAGITKVAHLQVALKQQHPPAFAACLQSMLMTMPPSWQAVVVAAPTAPTFFLFFCFFFLGYEIVVYSFQAPTVGVLRLLPLRGGTTTGGREAMYLGHVRFSRGS